MEIEAFPSVGAVTVEFDGEWLVITQYNPDGSTPDIVTVPNRLTSIFLDAITQSMGE